MMSWSILAQVMEASRCYVWCDLVAGDHIMAAYIFYVPCIVAVSPCWNMKKARIGSFNVNDPMVKVTFFKVRVMSTAKRKAFLITFT